MFKCNLSLQTPKRMSLYSTGLNVYQKKNIQETLCCFFLFFAVVNPYEVIASCHYADKKKPV